MSELAERSLEERLEETTAKLTTLEEAAWALLSALEEQDADAIVKAKRRLGLVFLEL